MPSPGRLETLSHLVTAHVDWESTYTLPLRGGGKPVEVLTAPLLRTFAFRAILAGCEGVGGQS
jgi:hypothetical protein